MAEHNDVEDCITISRTELDKMITNAVQTAVQKLREQLDDTLATDKRNILLTINEEMDRFTDRLKKLEAWQAEWQAGSKTKINCQQNDKAQAKVITTGIVESETVSKINMNNQAQVEGNEAQGKATETNGNKQTQSQEDFGGDPEEAGGSTGSDPESGDGGEWTRVVRKRRRNKIRRYGAVLIGGQNVSRVKAAAMDEFPFDQNVSCVTTTSDDFSLSLQQTIQKYKAKDIDVVIHLGAHDAVDHSADHVLEKLTDMVNYSHKQKNVKTVSVCSLEERRDAGSLVYQNIKTINTELAHLCLSTESTLIDLQSRLQECLYGAINRTGILYTFEGARNVAQHIISETVGFLD